MPTDTKKPPKSRKTPPGGGTVPSTDLHPGRGNLMPPWKPGESGNPSGRVAGDAKMRKLMDETLEMSRDRAIKALCARWASVKYVQDMAELKAKLDGELLKDTEGGRGVAILILNNQGAQPLDPETFRAAALARMHEQEQQPDR